MWAGESHQKVADQGVDRFHFLQDNEDEEGHIRDKTADDLTSTGSFDSVEAFWSYFHHLVRPSDLPNKHDWCMFKCGILPFSHHPDNVGGGKWTVRVRGRGERRLTMR